MATKKRRKTKTTKPKTLKRGQAIRVPGAGTVTIGPNNEVLWRGVPQQPNPTRRKKATKPRRKPTSRKRPTTRKRTAKRATSRRARR